MPSQAGQIFVDPTHSATLYSPGKAGSGVNYSLDGGATWDTASTAGLVGVVNAMAISPTTGGATVFAGTYESTSGVGGMFRNVGLAVGWVPIDQGFVATGVLSLGSDPTSSTIFAGTIFPSNVFKSIDAGSTWNVASAGITQTVSAFAVSRSNPADVYALGSSALFKTSDGGQSWRSIGSGLPANLY